MTPSSGKPQQWNKAPDLKVAPNWLIYLDLGCVGIAVGAWYFLPQAGLWPLVMALCPWLIRLILLGRLSERTAFDLPLLLFVGTAALGVWAAYDRQAAWSKFWLIIGGVLLFYALANAHRMATLQIWLLALFGTGLATWFLLTHNWDAYPVKIEILARLGKTLQAVFPFQARSDLNPNEAGGILAMLWPFVGLATAKAWQDVRRSAQLRWARSRLLVAAGMLALVSFGLLMTASRGAWIGLSSALGVAGVWVLLERWTRKNPGRRPWILLALLVLIVGSAVSAAVFWPGGLVSILTSLPGPQTGLSRVEFQRNSLTLVRDYPFVGAGLDGFQMLYSTYVLLIHVGFIEHSHNLYLSVAIDQGLPALAALLAMWILFFVVIWRRIGHAHVAGRQETPEPWQLGAAALSLIVVLVHGLADTALFGRLGILFLFVPLAFAAPTPQRQAEIPRARALLGLLIALMLMVALGVIWHRPLLSLLHSNLGAVHQSQIELRDYEWPQWPIQDAVRRAKDLSQPITEFERALTLDPRNPTANRRLGMIELSLGEYEDALRHLEAAYAVEPNSATTRQLLGEALIVNGHIHDGKALWADVTDDQSQLDIRVFWYQFIGDTERAEWIQQAANGE